MSLNEIKNSGLLELYVMGQLDGTQEQTVRQWLDEYPELINELREIEAALQQYATIHAIAPSAHIKAQLMDQIKTTPISGGETGIQNSKGVNFLAAIMIAVAGVLIAAYVFKNSQYKALLHAHDAQIAMCDSLMQAHEIRLAMLDQIKDPGTRILPIAATEKYPETNIYFFSNDTQKKNVIQVQHLPQLAENESFQLWSLKGESPPIPLDVFDGSQEALIEVAFVENSNAYAITIEPKGGSQSPNLDKLIGVFSI
jgi:anti-sigma-K factor RskA